MVHAIPSWKYFIFGGEVGDFPEGGPRNFGSTCNSACYLDIDTLTWSTVHTEDRESPDCVVPEPREYAAIAYDARYSRIIVFGGWNNKWLDSAYALNISKIVGPPYAVTDIFPKLGQLSGGVSVKIIGCGFKDTSITVYFTMGKTPVDVASKNSISVSGTCVSDTELTCITPSFDMFGPKEAVV